MSRLRLFITLSGVLVFVVLYVQPAGAQIATPTPKPTPTDWPTPQPTPSVVPQVWWCIMHPNGSIAPVCTWGDYAEVNVLSWSNESLRGDPFLS